MSLNDHIKAWNGIIYIEQCIKWIRLFQYHIWYHLWEHERAYQENQEPAQTHQRLRDHQQDLCKVSNEGA